MQLQPRKVVATAGVVACGLTAWWLLSGPTCSPGDDWPNGFSQARALWNARQSEPACDRRAGLCRYRIRTETTGQIIVVVEDVERDPSNGRCTALPDNQARYFYLPSGAPDRSASGPSM